MCKYSASYKSCDRSSIRAPFRPVLSAPALPFLHFAFAKVALFLVAIWPPCILVVRKIQVVWPPIISSTRNKCKSKSYHISFITQIIRKCYEFYTHNHTSFRAFCLISRFLRRDISMCSRFLAAAILEVVRLW